MIRTASLAFVSLVSLAAIPAAATVEQSRYTFRGDGFDGNLSSNDGCRGIDLYFSGADVAQKAGPGQPQQTNQFWGAAWVFDCDTQSWGEAWFDQANVTSDARGARDGATFSVTTQVQFGHWEATDELVCWSGEECWEDELGNVTCEPYEWCEYLWVFVDEGTKTLALDLALTPTGDSYRGMSSGSQSGPYGMYRYRSNGTETYATVSGTATLDGEDILSSSYSYGRVWTAQSGSMSLYRY